MSWRVAKSLDTLLGQINEAYPNRSKIVDGSIGDDDHSNRTSDHNPWCGPGVVTARDFTHDPEGGLDCHKLLAALIASKDERIKYIIWNQQIWRSYKTSASHPAPWTPQTYTGPNPHTKHLHLSINCNASKDSTRKWSIGGDWFDMATEKQLRRIVREEVNEAIKELAVGPDGAWNRNWVNLKAIEKRIKDAK